MVVLIILVTDSLLGLPPSSLFSTPRGPHSQIFIIAKLFDLYTRSVIAGSVLAEFMAFEKKLCDGLISLLDSLIVYVSESAILSSYMYFLDRVLGQLNFFSVPFCKQ